MPKNLRCRVLSFRFTTVALALLMLIAPGSRAQQAPPPVAQPAPVTASAAQTYKPVEGDFVAHDFHFKSGETLPELHLHYRPSARPLATRAAASPTRCSSCTAPVAGAEIFWFRNLPACCTAPDNYWTSRGTTSSCPTASATENPASPATACTRIFHNTNTTTWSPRNTCSLNRVSA